MVFGGADLGRWLGHESRALMNEVAAAAAKSLQSCPTLCDPIDGGPPGSPVPGILQARTLEWVAIAFSNAWKWKVKVKLLSRVWLLATPWTAAYQAPPSMGFSRQEYWSGVPLPSPWTRLVPFKMHTHTHTHTRTHTQTGVSHWLNGKESTCNAGATVDAGSITGSGRSPGGGHGNPL